MISLEKFSKYIHSRNLPAQDYIAITFDDGYRDNYTNAFPILEKYKVPVTVFLVTGYIGTNKLFWWDRAARIVKATIGKNPNIDFQEGIYFQKIKDILVKISSGDISNPTEATSLLCSLLKEISEEQKNLILDDLEKKILPLLKDDINRPYPLTWQEVRQMSEYGTDFGAHTVTHPILTRIGKEQAEREISHSKAEIERKICKRVFHFSYPNGKKPDFNEQIKQLVKNAGFLSACSTINGANELQDDIFSLRRRAVDNSPIYIFAAEIAGFLDLLILFKEKIGTVKHRNNYFTA